MAVDPSTIRDVSTPPRFAEPSTVDKRKRRADPPAIPIARPKHSSKKPAARAQEEVVVQPKRRGRPPKARKFFFFFEVFLIFNLCSHFFLAPIVFKKPVEIQ